MDFSTLIPLAQAVEQAGAPILAEVLRAAAPVVGAAIPIPGASLIVGPLLTALADAIGGSANDPSTITAQINADPTAATAKIRAVEDAHKDDLQGLLDMAKLQSDQDLAEINMTPILSWRDFVGRAFFAGWRPAAGWVFVISWVSVMFVTWRGGTVPEGFKPYFSGGTTIFMTLIAARSSDKVFGVATDSLKSAAYSGVTAAARTVHKLTHKIR
jgi:hypothetical protein